MKKNDVFNRDNRKYDKGEAHKDERPSIYKPSTNNKKETNLEETDYKKGVFGDKIKKVFNIDITDDKKRVIKTVLLLFL